MRISIITPTFNRSNGYLQDCINSFLTQDYKDSEQIVINDGGTDNTDEIMENFFTKDSRIKYLKKENGGISSALNAGIKIAEGELIFPVHDDNLLFENCLAGIDRKFKELERYKIESIYTSGWDVNSGMGVKNHYIATDFPLNTFLLYQKEYIHNGGIIYKKSIIDRIGGYNERLLHYDDWDYKIKLAQETNMLPVDIDTFYFRWHRGQKSILRRNLIDRNYEENKKMREDLRSRYSKTMFDFEEKE